jgi:hypothetical protein
MRFVLMAVFILVANPASAQEKIQRYFIQLMNAQTGSAMTNFESSQPYSFNVNDLYWFDPQKSAKIVQVSHQLSRSNPGPVLNMTTYVYLQPSPPTAALQTPAGAQVMDHPVPWPWATQ